MAPERDIIDVLLCILLLSNWFATEEVGKMNMSKVIRTTLRCAMADQFR